LHLPNIYFAISYYLILICKKTAVQKVIFIGVTTNDEWNNKIKKNPAPWGEVEIPGKFILTFPTKDLSLVNDIVAVGELYEKIMNWTIKFAGLETHYRAERIVFDIQISAGIHCKSQNSKKVINGILYNNVKP
jgi:hypothetical protein